MGQGQGGEGVGPRHGQHLDNRTQPEEEAQHAACGGAHQHRAYDDRHLDGGRRNGADDQVSQGSEGQKEDDCHQYRHTCDLLDFAAAVHNVRSPLRVFHLVLPSPSLGVRRTNYV